MIVLTPARGRSITVSLSCRPNQGSRSMCQCGGWLVGTKYSGISPAHTILCVSLVRPGPGPKRPRHPGSSMPPWSGRVPLQFQRNAPQSGWCLSLTLEPRRTPGDCRTVPLSAPLRAPHVVEALPCRSTVGVNRVGCSASRTAAKSLPCRSTFGVNRVSCSALAAAVG